MTSVASADQVRAAVIHALDAYPAPVRARPAAEQPIASYNPVEFALAGYAAALQGRHDTKVAAAFARVGGELAQRAMRLRTRLAHAVVDGSDDGASREAATLIAELGAVAAFTAETRDATYYGVCDALRQLTDMLPTPRLDWAQMALASTKLEPAA